MEQIFISNVKVNKVRHLNNLEINLSKNKRKHLIITGKNGSGKTSILDAMAIFLNSTTNSVEIRRLIQLLEAEKETLDFYLNNNEEPNVDDTIKARENNIKDYQKRIEKYFCGIMLEMNCPLSDIYSFFQNGNFVVAYYRADRIFKAHIPKHVEKIVLKSDYTIDETPREDFIKYLLDLKVTQALALSNGKKEKAEKIRVWFEKFENLLKKIFEDNSLKLEFDEDTFQFRILMNEREPFDFNTLSSGYAAILDIVVDLIIRMEKQTNKVFDFSVQGIVLIDEIETHLHLELQKKILELLTTIFPNVQFIVSTHSPFVLNSLENVIIYDLEKQLLVKDGLADIPYSGIVQGYFNADEMSMILREKYERYKELAEKSKLTDEDFEEIADLEIYLDEIPDYLALSLTTEYQRLKMELRNREDI